MKQSPNKNLKDLIIRIHYMIKPIPDFAARTISLPIVPNVCLVLFSVCLISKIKINNDAFCITFELNLQKTAKFEF